MRIKQLLVLCSIIIVMIVFFFLNRNKKNTELHEINKGKSVFQKNCFSCHVPINYGNEINQFNLDSLILRKDTLKEYENLHKILIESLNRKELNSLKIYMDFKRKNFGEI